VSIGFWIKLKVQILSSDILCKLISISISDWHKRSALQSTGSDISGPFIFLTFFLIFHSPSQPFLGWSDKKTYYLEKVDRSAQNLGLDQTLSVILGPLAAFLYFAGVARVRKCPFANRLSFLTMLVKKDGK